jgi:glycosyltransferase involved in cell wall biosynthesis
MTQPPIKILRITGPLNLSGPALHAVLLVKKLGPPDYESILVAGLMRETQFDVDAIILPELDPSLNIVTNLIAFWKLYRIIRDKQPDIVHTHTMKAGFWGRLAAKWAGVPVILHTYHEYPFHGYFSKGRTRRFVWLERVAARVSDTIIVLSESLRTALADTYRITRRSRITVLPIGLNLEAFAAIKQHHGGFRKQWNIPDDAPLIGIIGRLMPVKNHSLFVEAAAHIHRDLPDARFVIVGDGDLRDELEAQVAALGLREVVVFTGWQPDVAAVYGDLDVNVISSINEGTPLPVIESLAAGCPVVATAVGGLPDLLDGGALGRLVPSGDAKVLASAILETLQNPPDVTIARRAMLDRYSVDRLVRDLDGLYRGLLLAKRRITH